MKWLLIALLCLVPTLSYGTFLAPTPSISAIQPRVIQLSQRNTMVFEDEIDVAKMDVALTAITAKYDALPKGELLYVFIFSPGGSVDVAKASSDYLNTMPRLRLVCMDCESAAGWMFENSHTPRLIVSRSLIMMHEIRIFTVTPSIMKSIDLKQFADEGHQFNQIFATRMHMPLSIYEMKIEGINWVVQSSEMMNLGLADEVVNVVCDPFVSMLMPNTCSRVME